MKDAEFLEFLTSAFFNIKNSLKEGGSFYIWHADSEGYNFRRALYDAGLRVRQNLVWVKNSIVLGRQDYHWKHEPCLYGWKDGAGHYWAGGRKERTTITDFDLFEMRNMSQHELLGWIEKYLCDKEDDETTILFENKPNVSNEHPTMKPVRLIARQIRNSSKQGDTVLDLFGGSGSTLIACEQLGRKCYMMEYDPRFVDVIIKRWEDFTGKKAIKL